MSLQVNVNIADKWYPFQIEREDDEIRLRRAAKIINDRIGQYRKRFADKDTQDMLAMSSLQFVVKLLVLEEKLHASDNTERLQDLDRMLEDFLAQ